MEQARYYLVRRFSLFPPARRFRRALPFRSLYFSPSCPSALCSARLGRCYVTDRLVYTRAARGAPKTNEGGPTDGSSIGNDPRHWGSLPLFRRDCSAWLVTCFLSLSLSVSLLPCPFPFPSYHFYFYSSLPLLPIHTHTHGSLTLALSPSVTPDLLLTLSLFSRFTKLRSERSRGLLVTETAATVEGGFTHGVPTSRRWQWRWRRWRCRWRWVLGDGGDARGWVGVVVQATATAVSLHVATNLVGRAYKRNHRRLLFPFVSTFASGCRTTSSAPLQYSPPRTTSASHLLAVVTTDIRIERNRS